MNSTIQKARRSALESNLRQTHADQGGEVAFSAWLEYVAGDCDEYQHEEAAELVALGGVA